MYFVIVLLYAVLSAVCAVSFEDVVEAQWQYFKVEHKKSYKDDEQEQYRKSVFMDNLHKIAQHNQEYEMGLTSYKMGMNYLGDLTTEEFLETYTVKMPSIPESPTFVNRTFFYSYDEDELPNLDSEDIDVDMVKLPGHVDWRGHGVVTQVKNQGNCGSCWAFSTTGSLESQWKKKTGRLISLSEQNLIDCTRKYGNFGCNGGWMPRAFAYIRDNHGIDTEVSYHYTAHDGQCHFNRRAVGASIRGWSEFSGESRLQERVANVGPISAAIQVVGSLHLYHSGIYDDARCGKTINHAILVIGYGSERGRNFWLVKNSWGRGWGEGGYVRMSRNRGNQCAIASYCSVPLV